MLVWEFFENPELKCLLPDYDFYLAEVVDYADYNNKEAFFYNSRGVDYDGDIKFCEHTFDYQSIPGKTALYYQSNPDKTGFCYTLSTEELGDSTIVEIGYVKDYTDGEIHKAVWIYPPKRWFERHAQSYCIYRKEKMPKWEEIYTKPWIAKG